MLQFLKLPSTEFQCIDMKRFDLLLLAALTALLTLIPLPASAQVTCRPAAYLAGQILEGTAGWGDLPLEGFYALDEAALDDGRLVATVSVRLGIPELLATRNPRLGTLCAAVVVDAGGEPRVLDESVVEVPELRERQALASVEAWVFNVRLELPEDASQVMVLLQEPSLGTWGALALDEAGNTAPSPSPGAVRVASPRAVAWYEVVRRAAGSSPRAAGRDVLVRLIPPRNQPAGGSTRFDAMTTSDAVARVVFELDGEQVSVERRRPFVARLPLADPPRVQTVRAVALDRDGRPIGEDSLIVNQLDVPFRVRISGFRPRDGGFDVDAQVAVPPDGALERVELYLNEQLVESFEPPVDSGPGGRIARFSGSVSTAAPTPEDYVRVAAFLADGASIDDVVLLASPGQVEEVEVNLVELHVVVSDRDRRPVADLGLADFEVLHRGKKRQIESFAFADDVPLLMGLVVDTSGSMQLVMQDTKRAAAKFIGQTVLPQDRAFVVDFDQRPRLRQPTTAEVTDLMLSLGQLQANGATAMYDAIIFSMIQFEKQRGRKALVVLTDGDDHESRYAPKDCVEFGQRLGVPIYVIGLGALDSLRRTYSTADLKRVTSQTGGRLYFVESLEELEWAYAEINAELRSQYSLTFYADSDLSDEERRKVEVRLGRKGLEARTVLGTSGR